MYNLLEYGKARLDAFRVQAGAFRQSPPAERWFSCLFWSFWISLVTFPMGYAIRDIMPLVCLVFLALYYRHNWQNSVLRRLGAWPLFVCFGLMVLIGVVFSSNVGSSLLHASSGLNKGFILPFIAMECVRNEKDLLRLVWASVLAVFWQGLDGIYQALTGKDFLMGYPPNCGRLTGSFDDYEVGNYIALALIPALSLWYILRQWFSRLPALLLYTATLWPAFFLLAGAASRSGALAIAAALGLWCLLADTGNRIKSLLYASAALFLILQAQGRAGMDEVLGDGRWSLWKMGWRVFLEHPWFGSGAGQYNAAFRALGLTPEKDLITISHPHNLYLDMLYAHGLVGFTFGMIFLLGFSWWGYQRIRPQLLAERAYGRTGIYWRMTAWFWIGFVAWLFNGIFGHDFYRVWWLALAMGHLGVMIGAVVNGPSSEETARPAP
ncbi:MAG: O-antigen ligase family protein [Desulfovibrio sp.]|uniref:O-antigen ligase family protein n=1 Tax=Desulfovibrio sp. TaxID=885 RepID=UPI002A35DBFB|nr:O-antigen ligase family protein [Desulfovibrio sp.]MDY0259862.1 O-antigen ligase family protein [Desulfovibrio sp.]